MSKVKFEPDRGASVAVTEKKRKKEKEEKKEKKRTNEGGYSTNAAPSRSRILRAILVVMASQPDSTLRFSPGWVNENKGALPGSGFKQGLNVVLLASQAGKPGC